MIEHIGGNPEASSNPWGSLFKSIVILRIGTGLLLLKFHAWAALHSAYDFLWEELPWEWVNHFNDAGLPWPTLLAPASAILLGAVALSWITGFLTRLFAFLFLPFVGAFILFAGEKGAIYVEAGWLYLLASFTLLLFGSGAVSLDKLFHIGENWGSSKKKKKGW